MRQKFYKSTIQSKFIKSLLRNTAIPIYDTVSLHDYIVKGNTYLYKCKLIKCTESGYLGGPEYPTDELQSASFTTLQHIDFKKSYPKETEYFYSVHDYYDKDSHVWLGKYLRALRDIWDIDLLPYYNCYNGDTIDTLYIKDTISGTEISDLSQDIYKIAILPVRFNQTYTIAIDCPSKVWIQPIFLNMDKRLEIRKIDLTDYLKTMNNTVTYTNLSFNSPITYSVHNTDTTTVTTYNIPKDQFFQQYERDLYLLIQLPKNNQSSIVVLDGDYTKMYKQNVFDINALDDMLDEKVNSLMTSPLNLLLMNDTNLYPFSDRLIEYLLLNTITYRDEFHHDIEEIQDKITPEIQSTNMYGIWDNKLRYKIWNKFRKNIIYPNIDVNGYVTKDVEKFISKL